MSAGSGRPGRPVLSGPRGHFWPDLGIPSWKTEFHRFAGDLIENPGKMAYS